MPRNSSGTYSLPESAFVPSTPISSTAVNSDFSDIAEALTDSLSRTGDGGMQAVLPLSGAGFNYQGDSNTGMSRSTADTQVITCGGTDIVEVTTTGANITGNLDADTVTQGGNSIIPVGSVMIWSLSTAPTRWLFPGTYNRADYAALWTAANTDIGLGNTFYGVGNGTTTFTIGTMDGFAPVGVDSGGGTLPGVGHIGATAGAATETLLTGNLPAYTPTGSVSSSTATTIPVYNNTSVAGSTVTNSVALGNSGNAAAGTLNVATGGGASTTTSGFTGTAQGGTSTPFSIAQPSRAFKFIIYAGV